MYLVEKKLRAKVFILLLSGFSASLQSEKSFLKFRYLKLGCELSIEWETVAGKQLSRRFHYCHPFLPLPSPPHHCVVQLFEILLLKIRL